MKTLVMEIPEIDYALIHWPDNKVTPWVAAWLYNKESNCWGQGHYFCKKEDALQYIADVMKERYPMYLEKRINQILAA